MSQGVLIHPTGNTDRRVIGLIGLAHGLSHFFQLVLPPLFPLLIADFKVTYTDLGVVMTTFFVVSGLMQTVAGFLVDRFGARQVLFAGLGLYSVAIACYALAPNLWMMLPAAVAAGIGNSVFHPADYSILTASVSSGRLGRAYGIHTFGGNLGWAAAPPTMLLLAEAIGWRSALAAVALVGFAVLALLVIDRAELRHSPRPPAPAGTGKRPSALAGLISAPIVLCFAYFFLLSVASIAVQNFMPITLDKLFGTPLILANYALTGYLLGAAAGVIAGGMIADRFGRLDAIVAVGMSTGAIFLLIVGAVALPPAALIAMTTLAGFASGSTTPSRDLLVRGAAPKGAMGRVFGLVYSGLDAGSAVAPLAIGLMLDHNRPHLVFWTLAAGMFLATFTAFSITKSSRPQES